LKLHHLQARVNTHSLLQAFLLPIHYKVRINHITSRDAFHVPDQTCLPMPQRGVSPAGDPYVSIPWQILDTHQLQTAGWQQCSRHQPGSNSQRTCIVQVALQLHACHHTTVTLAPAAQQYSGTAVQKYITWVHCGTTLSSWCLRCVAGPYTAVTLTPAVQRYSNANQMAAA
jgi:hypothetical protein